MADVVLYEKRGHVAIFTLNRPKAMNAVSGEVSQMMEMYLDQFHADDSLWVGIICSSHDRVFCAGADLKAVNSGTPIATAKGGFAGLVQYPLKKPMIAAVDGAALAGGCEICLACDLIVASTKSRFGVPEVKRSLIPAAGGLFRLPQKLPHRIAMELILTGDPIPAERAYNYGFVNRLCGPGESLTEALKLADAIVANAPIAVREAKACVDQIRNEGMDDAAAFKRSNQGMRMLSKTPDFKEGPRAFIEKRDPVWTGKPAPPRKSKL